MNEKASAGRLATTLMCLAALSALPTDAMATDPIPGVDVVVEKVPSGRGTRLKTDRNGCLQVDTLASGRYLVHDTFGNKAIVDHDGGPAKWRLVGVVKGGRPNWSLLDLCIR